jgi:hypothetical protein
MAIPESPLETWSHQGAVTTSKDAYATVKRALESKNAAYANREFKVFLQGSYGNDTNIRTESDVDIVICHTGAFFHDLEHLTTVQQSLFKAHFADGTYSYSTFKADVQAALVAAFGNSVQPSKKAFKIAASGPRRSADVVCAFDHRRYTSFNGVQDETYYEGISFFTAANTRIDNFPKYHSQNLTTKHQATRGKFKPAMRIFKNMRSKMIERGLIANGEAPSYFIEGLLYNVPNDRFVNSLSDTTFNILTWLHQTPDRSQFVCANDCYYLLRDSSQVCWPKANGQKFISAAIALWNNWAGTNETAF